MEEEKKLQSAQDFCEPIFIETFEDDDNEKEEDIGNLESLDFGSVAISGTDWTAETLVSQIGKGNIIMNPDFQRRDAWTQRTKSRFIESLFIGLPVPQIILAEQSNKRGSYIVIDGKQRLLALKQFVLGNEDGKYLKLTGLEVKKNLNKKTFADISDGLGCDEVEAFNNQTIRTVVIKNWKDPQVLYLLFLRLNTGSVKLSPQELRQALYPGAFIKFANEASAQSQEIKDMLNLKKPDFRMRDVEILIRYFAFRYYRPAYSGSLQQFLDNTCESLNNSWDARENEIKKDFEDMKKAIAITRDIFGSKYAFKKYKAGKYEEKYNRAVIDIMLYSFSHLKNAELLSPYYANIKAKFEELCMEDAEFLAALETTTKSIAAVNCRFSKWEQAMSNLVSPELYHEIFSE